MRKEKTFKIDEQEFVARELTVKEIAQITDTLSPDMEVNDIDMLFPDRIPSSAPLHELLSATTRLMVTARITAPKT